ncbi:hypothetical protein [Bacillus sp. AK031]
MGSKQWFIKLLATSMVFVIVPVAGIMGFNYWMDPLWNFSHQHSFNDYQIGFNERQQKTNMINSEDFDYDGLMIGTSRVTYMNHHDYEGQKVYNYSLSSLHIDEYLPYIEYAVEKNDTDFETIYMELYFNSFNDDLANNQQDPSVYIDKAEDPLYKFTSLFSLSTLESSMENYKISKENSYDGPRSYTRDNVAQTTFPNDGVPGSWGRFVERFKKEAEVPFAYSEQYKSKLENIKQKYPETEFKVFTDPIPAQRLDLILNEEDQRKAYERWFKDMIDVFGKVYSFQGHTPVTTNIDNYFDWFHYYPSVGHQMNLAIQNPEAYEDIMEVVTEENLDEYLKELYKQSGVIQ